VFLQAILFVKTMNEFQFSKKRLAFFRPFLGKAQELFFYPKIVSTMAAHLTCTIDEDNKTYEYTKPYENQVAPIFSNNGHNLVDKSHLY